MEENVQPTMIGKLKGFSRECLRVLRVTRKPTMTEFKTIVKVSGIGILAIGFLGFALHMISQMF